MQRDSHYNGGVCVCVCAQQKKILVSDWLLTDGDSWFRFYLFPELSTISYSLLQQMQLLYVSSQVVIYDDVCSQKKKEKTLYAPYQNHFIIKVCTLVFMYSLF